MSGFGLSGYYQVLKALYMHKPNGEPMLIADRRRRWALNRIKDRVGHSKDAPHQGARECARRRRQMGLPA